MPQTKTKIQDDTMESLIKDAGLTLIPFHQGQIVEATVIQASASKIWADINGLTIGVVPEREMSILTANLKPGDKIHALVVDVEDERGNMILSLRRADQERLNDDLKAKFQEGKTVDVIVKEANKGGLLIDIGDYQGFLPVSQLASRHYPKVDGGDPDKIFSRLKDLMGETLEVKIINFDSNAKKLIFSEKAAGDREQEEKLSQIKEGETVEGTVTGIVDFGIFVKIGEGKSEIEGLVHISEIAWGRVTNLTELYKVGDKIKVLIVSTDENRVSLSVKRLQNDPWRTAAKKYKISDTMNGEVTKITDYGLFVRIDNEIDGLVHLSEMMAEKAEKIEDISEKFEIGKKYNFRIISFDPDAHRLGLSLKSEEEDSKNKKKTADAEDKKEKKTFKIVAKSKTATKKKEVDTEKSKPKKEEVL